MGLRAFLGSFTGNPSADVDGNMFMDTFGAKMVWERKPLPGPGAMNYAYETLALAPQSEISGAVAQRQQLSLFSAGQVYKYLDVLLDGIPLVSGQLLGQPLYDPATGSYNDLVHQSTSADLVGANIVADRNGPRGMNAPFLTNT